MEIERFTELEFKIHFYIEFLGKNFEEVAKKYGIDEEKIEKIYENIKQKSERNFKYYKSQDYFDVYLASSYRRFDQLRRTVETEKKLSEMGYRVISPLNVRFTPARLGRFEYEMMNKSKAFFGILFAETYGVLNECRKFIEDNKPAIFWISKRKEFLKNIHPTNFNPEKRMPHFSTEREIAFMCLEDELNGKVEFYVNYLEEIPILKCKRCNSNLKILNEKELCKLLYKDVNLG